MTAPFVGMPVAADLTCAYAGPDIDRPCRCAASATTHVRVASSWDYVAGVSLATCGTHLSIARQCGVVLAEHVYTAACGESCW